LSRGPCYYDQVRPAVVERIAGKRIERAWITAIDMNDVDD
jgi:hypothetical protein